MSSFTGKRPIKLPIRVHRAHLTIVEHPNQKIGTLGAQLQHEKNFEGLKCY